MSSLGSIAFGETEHFGDDKGYCLCRGQRARALQNGVEPLIAEFFVVAVANFGEAVGIKKDAVTGKEPFFFLAVTFVGLGHGTDEQAIGIERFDRARFGAQNFCLLVRGIAIIEMVGLIDCQVKCGQIILRGHDFQQLVVDLAKGLRRRVRILRRTGKGDLRHGCDQSRRHSVTRDVGHENAEPVALRRKNIVIVTRNLFHGFIITVEFEAVPFVDAGGYNTLLNL
jgi:hypothetical protein